MRNRLRNLLIVMVSLFLFTNMASAMSLLNKVPAVTGTVIDSNGVPIEGVLVNVKFYEHAACNL